MEKRRRRGVKERRRNKKILSVIVGEVRGQAQPELRVGCDALAVTRVAGGAEGAVHAPALPIDAAAAHEGDAGAQQEALAQHVWGDALPAHGQALVCNSSSQSALTSTNQH